MSISKIGTLMIGNSNMITPIVACNIYITAAASHASTLLSLLRRAQDHCRDLRHASQQHNKRDDKHASVAIVHAYADIPYDRSSFHLAGNADCVADVASRLICNALDEIDLDIGNNSHPTIGVIDHISVMKMRKCTDNIAATTAKQIGNNISKTNIVNLYYYGSACPNNTSLATVRRRTSFFNSGGAIDKEDNHNTEQEDTTTKRVAKGSCTIGTPANFVENYNIRLTSNISFEQAKTLTQFVRGRNIETKGYGVLGVEALTLPYGREKSKVYEVACNLTSPKVGSAEKVQAQLMKWIDKQRQELCEINTSADISKYNYDYFVEKAYRVGTTENQCIDVLSKDDISLDDLDKDAYNKFQDLLL